MLKLISMTFFAFLFLSEGSLGNSQNSEVKIVVLGDSLTAGYGIASKDSFPSVLEKLLYEDGQKHIRVINAGISGSTTASGLSRLKWQMKGSPSHIIIALGSNDGLRGFKADETERNLRKLIKFCLDNKLKVMLTGIQVPPNYGPKYTKEVKNLYKALAQEFKIPFMPFLLEGVAGEKKYNQPDGIHPNEEGHRMMAQNLLKYVKGML